MTTLRHTRWTLAAVAAVAALGGCAPAAAGPPATTAPAPPAVRASPAFAELRVGSTGPAVAQVQQALGDLGYQARERDGDFDTETGHAVVAFQKAQGLARTGVVDQATHDALRKPVLPRARSAEPGRHVEVDLAKQLTDFVLDGRIERTYDSSTGMDTPEKRTAPGEYRISYQIDGWRHAPLGPMYRPSYLDDTGLAFHGGEPVEAEPASNGCIRLTDASVDEVYDQLAPGTKVLIY